MPSVTNVLVVGDNNVGKTSLVHYLKYDEPLESPSATVGVEFTTLRLDGHSFHVWDVEGLHTMSLIDISRFSHVFVVCDAADVSTVQPYVNHLTARHTTPATLVANKCETVPPPHGYMATSALLGTGVNALRRRLLQLQLNNVA